ncbi:hypothetical protein [Tumebacillus flagellatus]|uniref:hypothetical protein n=1 Tax=Tumebacillus flagellatus TaxID=1157490 RepID=UPI0013BE8E82|nr:hypothetical protein [Tumebacillus flagellatus]
MLDHNRHEEPSIAPGLEDDELQREATQEEKAQGDTTMVTTLSLDENDNGSRNSSES